MQILKLEGVVLQNNCLFVYDQLQKSLSTTFDNYFHKTTDHHSHNTKGEKLNVPITKNHRVFNIYYQSNVHTNAERVSAMRHV